VVAVPAAGAGGLDWQPCPDRPALQCADLVVPLDHADPDGRSVSLAVRRLPAANAEQRIGVLLTLAGGPGQRGTDLVDSAAHPPAIASRFDIVGFDPRGTSGETDITCIPRWDPFDDLDRTPDDARERRALDERIEELAMRCREAHADVLPYLGTSDTVLDIDVLREALGEEQLSLLGWSYGSAVALRYASAYPEHIRALVLDGYSDPNLAPPDRELEQAAAFEQQLDELLVECALRDDCPLDGPDPGATIDRLLEALDQTPLPAGADRRLREGDAYEALTGALVRGPAERERLLGAVANASRGDGRLLLELAERYRRDFEASGLDLGSFAALTCADDSPAWADLTSDELAALRGRIQEAAPRLGAWLWSPPAAPHLPPIGLCAMMPTSPSSEAGPYVGTGAGTVLVLAASGDPATPLSAAVRGVGQLEDVSLLVIRADQHLVYPGAVADPGSATSDCVLRAVEAYLVEGQPPEREGCP
jgi:pimeloyl-ACP methyl ester carboxylesterase